MIIFSLVCFLDILIAVKGFQRGGSKGIALGCGCIGAFVVTLSYTISLFVQDYFVYSVLSSIYFGGIDFTLVCMMLFNWYFINPHEDKHFKKAYWVILFFAVLDELIIALLGNCHQLCVPPGINRLLFLRDAPAIPGSSGL